jgi:hypothetical protein
MAMTASDFNDDGIPDLALVDLLGNLTILRGSSSGLFNSAGQYVLQGSPVAMATTDFNGDGRLDLVVATSLAPPQPNFIELFKGSGDGAFEELTPITFPGGPGVADVTAGDFDGDGKQDLAVLVTTQGGGSADEILIFPGNGDGSFQEPRSYPVGTGASTIVTGDFNGDGILDLATANNGTNGELDGSISVLLGKRDGTFSAGTPIALSQSTDIVGPYSIATADLNRDGKADLAVTLSNGWTTGGLAVLLGRGDGTFLPPVLYPATAANLAIGDLGGDGIPDLIVSAPAFGQGPAGYLLGNGDGTFASEITLPAEGPLVFARRGSAAPGILRTNGAEPFALGRLPRSENSELLSVFGDFGVVSFLETSPLLRGPRLR